MVDSWKGAELISEFPTLIEVFLTIQKPTNVRVVKIRVAGQKALLDRPFKHSSRLEAFTS